MYALVLDCSDYDSTEYTIVACHEDENLLQRLADEGNSIAEKLHKAIQEKDFAIQNAMNDIPFPCLPRSLEGKNKKHLTTEEKAFLVQHRENVSICLEKRKEVILELEKKYIQSDEALRQHWERNPSGQGRYHVQPVLFDTPRL